MIGKFFYTHLVNIESLIVELDELNLTKAQKVEIASLVDSSLHHSILDAVLSELTPSEKYLFLRHLTNNDSPSIWKLLNKLENIEDKIKSVSVELKKELSKEIKEAKKR